MQYGEKKTRIIFQSLIVFHIKKKNHLQVSKIESRKKKGEEKIDYNIEKGWNEKYRLSVEHREE